MSDTYVVECKEQSTKHEHQPNDRGQIWHFFEDFPLHQWPGFSWWQAWLHERERHRKTGKIDEPNDSDSPPKANLRKQLADHDWIYRAAKRISCCHNSNSDASPLSEVSRNETHRRTEDDPTPQAGTEALRQQDLPEVRTQRVREYSQ